MTNKIIYELLDEYAEANQEFGDMDGSDFYNYFERKEQQEKCFHLREQIDNLIFRLSK